MKYIAMIVSIVSLLAFLGSFAYYFFKAGWDDGKMWQKESEIYGWDKEDHKP